MPNALKSGPKSNKSPTLVTLPISPTKKSTLCLEVQRLCQNNFETFIFFQNISSLRRKKFRWLSFCGFKIWKIWPIKMRNLNSPSCLWTLSLSLSLSLFLNLLLSSFRSLLYLVLLCLLILFLLLFCQSRNDQFFAYFYANCMRSI